MEINYQAGQVIGGNVATYPVDTTAGKTEASVTFAPQTGVLVALGGSVGGALAPSGLLPFDGGGNNSAGGIDNSNTQQSQLGGRGCPPPLPVACLTFIEFLRVCWVNPNGALAPPANGGPISWNAQVQVRFYDPTDNFKHMVCCSPFTVQKSITANITNASNSNSIVITDPIWMFDGAGIDPSPPAGNDLPPNAPYIFSQYQMNFKSLDWGVLEFFDITIVYLVQPIYHSSTGATCNCYVYDDLVSVSPNAYGVNSNAPQC